MPNINAVLTNIGTFFTSAMGWLGDVLEVVTSSPALLIMVIAIPVAGVAIGYLKRLISL